jgi:hypothetical protein
VGSAAAAAARREEAAATGAAVDGDGPEAAGGAGEVADGLARPLELRAPAGDGTAGRPRLDGRVRVAAGPWALEEGWWRDHPVDRDYWDVELAAGSLVRIFRERASGAWYADGIYD